MAKVIDEAVTEMLFSSTVKDGVLKKERELAGMCPIEFMDDDNPWAQYVMKIATEGGDTGNWKWLTDDEDAREIQFGHFCFLIGASHLSHNELKGLAGWMLSNMLEEVPEYVPVGYN